MGGLGYPAWQPGAELSFWGMGDGLGIELGCAEGRRKAEGDCSVQTEGRLVAHIPVGRIEVASICLLVLWGQRAGHVV